MNKILLVLLFSTALFANYTNCNFKNHNYEDICKKSVKAGVSYDYVNRILLSKKKTKSYDEFSWKYLHSSKIVAHRKNEKKANNTLVTRIPQIVKHLKKYAHVYDYTEKKFGVNREIIAAILMKETGLGKIPLKHDAFEVFNTIVVKSNPKTSRDRWLLKMGKSNMLAVIKYCYKKKLTPEMCNLPSSYAGAVGIPQFMPNSFYYTQGYKTKYADLNKMEDAIVSASKYLHKKASFKELIVWDKLTNIAQLESQWYDYELKYSNASLVYTKNRDNKPYRCFLCKDKKYSYLKTYAKKIMSYNNSSNYAMGVIRIAYECNIELRK